MRAAEVVHVAKGASKADRSARRRRRGRGGAAAAAACVFVDDDVRELVRDARLAAEPRLHRVLFSGAGAGVT